MPWQSPPCLSPACPHREHRSAAAAFLFPAGPRAQTPIGTVSRAPGGALIAAGVLGVQLVLLSAWQQRACLWRAERARCQAGAPQAARRGCCCVSSRSQGNGLKSPGRGLPRPPGIPAWLVGDVQAQECPCGSVETFSLKSRCLGCAENGFC